VYSDFFGFNAQDELQSNGGRLDASRRRRWTASLRELYEAMSMGRDRPRPGAQTVVDAVLDQVEGLIDGTTGQAAFGFVYGLDATSNLPCRDRVRDLNVIVVSAD